jgi:hypothetical protein
MSAEARVTLASVKAYMNVAAVISNQHAANMSMDNYNTVSCPWELEIQEPTSRNR